MRHGMLTSALSHRHKGHPSIKASVGGWRVNRKNACRGYVCRYGIRAAQALRARDTCSTWLDSKQIGRSHSSCGTCVACLAVVFGPNFGTLPLCPFINLHAKAHTIGYDRRLHLRLGSMFQ